MRNPFNVFIDDFEAEAEAFLRKYQCEDAIENPRRIPIRDIATRLMSLEVVQSECLSMDGSVQGAISFTKGVVDVYDWTSGQQIGYQVDNPAIFIDSDITNEGRVNNTLSHECFHWYKHRNYFTFKRTHENSAEFGLRCDKNIGKSGDPSEQCSDVARMEWQAKTIAPKILMPRKATIKKIDQLYNDRIRAGGNPAGLVDIEIVVGQLANFFAVSKQSAAIRMMELGHLEAEPFTGDFVAPDDGHHSRQSSRAAQHQQAIVTADAFQLYMKSDFLRATIDTGAFCFADGYFVLKDEKYVLYSDEHKFVLTDYAKVHLYECALDFSTKLIAEPYLIHDEMAHLMFRADTGFQREASYDNNPQNTELYNKAKEFERKFTRSKTTHRTACEMLQEYMADAHWNASIFTQKTSLDAINYTRVQQNYSKFTLRPLVTMGYCLGLDETEMEEILNAQGLAFSPTNLTHQAYKFLFTAFPDRNVDACNEFLEAQGVDLLGSQSRK